MLLCFLLVLAVKLLSWNSQVQIQVDIQAQLGLEKTPPWRQGVVQTSFIFLIFKLCVKINQIYKQ